MLYSTSDYWTAVFLKSKGIKLSKVERQGQRCYFVFESTQDFNVLINDYLNNALVGISSIRNAAQDLKAIIHNDFDR